MLRIMVVDRERDICELFEKILKSLGHSVKVQESLVKNLGDEEYDLMICDLESIKQNKKKVFDASHRMKLCLSSVWKESNLLPDLGFEYDYYLRKHFTIDSIRKILDSVLYLSPSPSF